MNRRLHPANLVFGTIFCAVAGLWFADRQDLLSDDQVGTLVAVCLIVLGAAGVLGTLVAGRRGRGARPAPEAGTPETIETTEKEEATHDQATDPQR